MNVLFIIWAYVALCACIICPLWEKFSRRRPSPEGDGDRLPRMPRRRSGFVIYAVHLDSHRLEIMTPRNYNVALAMIETHAYFHGKGWSYRLCHDYNPRFHSLYFENV